MLVIPKINETDLTQQTRQVMAQIQQGQPIIIENQGQPEAAIIDVVDYYLMRAVLAYHNRPQTIEMGTGLENEAVDDLSSVQEKYNLVLTHYLADNISLARTAELLGISAVSLRFRFLYLDIPLRIGPLDEQEIEADAMTAADWANRVTA